MIQILDRPQGSNITLMNATYVSNYKIQEEGKKEKTVDVMTIVYKDAETGVKYAEEIPNPLIEFYMAKEGYRTDYNRLFINETDSFPVVCEKRKLEKTIAHMTGNMQYYYDNMNTGNFKENRKLHTHPDVFASDVDMEDFYRAEFSRQYVNEPLGITKSYLDIEVDSINIKGDFPEMGECPVNACSVDICEISTIFVFLLRNKNNPMIAEFEKEVAAGGVGAELLDFVIDTVGGPKQAAKFKLDNYKFKFFFVDEEAEIELIKTIFAVINHFKPDFTMAWNMGFDIPFLIKRIENLGYNPAEIICHSDFEFKVARYLIDTRHEDMYAERTDKAVISSYTVYLDQMIHFASRRKAIKYKSYKLDDIGEIIAGVRKLDYKHICNSVDELPYKNYKVFVFYNVIDVIVQHCIEANTQDLEYLFNKSLMNDTRYDKIHRQTVYLTNRANKIFRNKGFVIGNNCNKYKPAANELTAEQLELEQKNFDEDDIPGAFVADPMLLDSTSKMTVFGRVIDVLNNLLDEDYSSLYPSIWRQFNIATVTLIGHIIMPDKIVHPKENLAKLDTWTRELQFAEDIQSRMWLEFCTRWHGLPSFTEMYNLILNGEFFNELMTPINGIRPYTENGYVRAFRPIGEKKYVRGFTRINDDRRTIEAKFKPYDEKLFKEFRENAIRNPNQHF